MGEKRKKALDKQTLQADEAKAERRFCSSAAN